MIITKNVFIDTSIFIDLNYNYAASVFANIIRLSKSEKAKLFVTDITLQEIESHIKSDIAKAIQVALKFKRDARVLRNIMRSPYTEKFVEIDKNEAFTILKQQLDAFLRNTNVTIISTSDVSISTVFDKYFNKAAPFGDGKKKSEFPDAFVLEALENWCKSNNSKMYVASKDKDLKKHCDDSENLVLLEKLAEFISLVEFHEETLAPDINRLIEDNKEVVVKAIEDDFKLLGFWLDDQDGDVNEITVDTIEILDSLLLDIDQNHAIAQLDINIKFNADITYDDMDTASYDSEDKVLIPWQQINKVVEQSENLSVTLYIEHDAEERDFFDLDKVEINTRDSDGIAVISDDEWPYK